MPGVAPWFCKAHSLPYFMIPLVAKGIIEPVQFADWAAPIIPVLKQDMVSVRICGDFKLTVNQVSKMDCYPISKLASDKLFTHLDLSQAYQQFLLDNESKDCRDKHSLWDIQVQSLAIWSIVSSRNISTYNGNTPPGHSKCCG